MEQNNNNKTIEELLDNSISSDLRIKLNQELLICKKMFNPQLDCKSIVKYVKPEIVKFEPENTIFEVFSKPHLRLERMLKLEYSKLSFNDLVQKLENDYSINITSSEEYLPNFNWYDGYDIID
jgi:hypothetical protein